jgi:MoaA/NifB/PqqE/SkfB family radical SAM enzyme
VPVNIDVVLTKHCNLSCLFCKHYETPGKTQITVEDFRKLAEILFPTAQEVRFCSGGEPYLHPGLMDILEISKLYRVNMFLLSNGMLLSEEKIRRIVREELVSVHGFSVDGIRSATVESLRIKSNLKTILNNIEMLKNIRDAEGKSGPRIIIRYAIMRSNITELPDAVRYWGEKGIDAIDCNYLSVCNDINPQESLYYHQEIMKQSFQNARTIALQYPHLALNLPPTVEDDLKFINNPKSCREPFRFVYIDTDGRILPCYLSFGVLVMGNVYDNAGRSFRKTWNCIAYRKLRATVNNDQVEKYFPYCSVCESRFGWGKISSHMGNQTWMSRLRKNQTDKEKTIEKRRQ